MCNYVAYATQTTQLACTWYMYINASLEELRSSISRCANLAKGFFFFMFCCSLAFGHLQYTQTLQAINNRRTVEGPGTFMCSISNILLSISTILKKKLFSSHGNIVHYFDIAIGVAAHFV